MAIARIVNQAISQANLVLQCALLARQASTILNLGHQIALFVLLGLSRTGMQLDALPVARVLLTKILEVMCATFAHQAQALRA